MAGEFRFIPQETLDDIANLVNPVLDFVVPLVPYVAVLAFLPKSEIEMVLRTEHAGPLTGMPRPARDELEAAFEHVRQHGFASYREPKFDSAGVAAPVFNGENEILGCLGVITLSSRFSPTMEQEVAAVLRAAAEDLSQQAAVSPSPGAMLSRN